MRKLSMFGNEDTFLRQTLRQVRKREKGDTFSDLNSTIPSIKKVDPQGHISSYFCVFVNGSALGCFVVFYDILKNNFGYM